MATQEGTVAHSRHSPEQDVVRQWMDRASVSNNSCLLGGQGVDAVQSTQWPHLSPHTCPNILPHTCPTLVSHTPIPTHLSHTLSTYLSPHTCPHTCPPRCSCLAFRSKWTLVNPNFRSLEPSWLPKTHQAPQLTQLWAGATPDQATSGLSPAGRTPFRRAWAPRPYLHSRHGTRPCSAGLSAHSPQETRRATPPVAPTTAQHLCCLTTVTVTLWPGPGPGCWSQSTKEGSRAGTAPSPSLRTQSGFWALRGIGGGDGGDDRHSVTPEPLTPEVPSLAEPAPAKAAPPVTGPRDSPCRSPAALPGASPSSLGDQPGLLHNQGNQPKGKLEGERTGGGSCGLEPGELWKGQLLGSHQLGGMEEPQDRARSLE